MNRSSRLGLVRGFEGHCKKAEIMGEIVYNTEFLKRVGIIQPPKPEPSNVHISGARGRASNLRVVSIQENVVRKTEGHPPKK